MHTMSSKWKNFKAIYIFLIFLSIVSILMSVCLGAVTIAPDKTFGIILRVLTNGLIDIVGDVSLVQERIVMELRLPRVLLGFVVGSSLATAGVAMQAMVRNELADPFILGVSSGASCFATLGMIFGVFSFLGSYALPISAFLGAACSIMIVYLISRVNGKVVITQLLLSGVVVAMIFEGITKIITISAPNALGLHNAEFWMSGSLANTKWSFLTLPTITMIICISYLLINYRMLNALLLGEAAASTIGINVRRSQKMLILITSLLAGVTISVSGTIGFVGLICPHFSRLLVGGDHRKMLPLSALIGGILVVWTDVLARILIAPEELPIGVLTSILGGPFFIMMLKRNRKH